MRIAAEATKVRNLFLGFASVNLIAAQIQKAPLVGADQKSSGYRRPRSPAFREGLTGH
jgi:hypothetical protein